MKSVVVHYQEIALKGNNRPWFVSRLARNLRLATKGAGVKEVRVLMGRIELLLEEGADWEMVRERVSKVFGIANFAKAGTAKLDLDAIADAILADIGDPPVASFRVSARRADKRFPVPSPQIEREVGGRRHPMLRWGEGAPGLGPIVQIPVNEIVKARPDLEMGEAVVPLERRDQDRWAAPRGVVRNSASGAGRIGTAADGPFSPARAR